jgi:hypothetical protein
LTQIQGQSIFVKELIFYTQRIPHKSTNKKKMKKLLSVSLALCCSVLLSSCWGTFINVLSHGKSTVTLLQTPSDIEVRSNGKKLDINKEVFTGGTNVSYYASAVKLPSKHRTTIELYSPSLNKKATVNLRPRASRNIIWLDILTTFGTSLIVDGPTGNLKMLTPRLIDVESALAGKPQNEWKSQGKLKRMAKRQAKHG